MAWLLLIIAGVGEVIGVAGINKVNQEKSVSAFITLIGGFVMSFVFLSIAMESLPMSTAYAVWTGMGTVGSALVGMVVYGESKDWRRILFISMILSAAVGLKLIS
ncbi:QacE family quaternary ammonium compound efflux SMR transporter [Virgibacillus dakarensis]|uniref:QacE family quaternary ammonium compound efflux SMR transporter n=1 Tax=Lentibacillus populi TaxID=1827502 RepID=A0A9W5TVR5_9BACI|nr:MULTISPECIES: multidrug efflux SMR transporter [Bacillaceae]MBT2217614.1 multidrug efflux SMR transporter [Virgibacillus dakarensis]MTW84734.1 QacE family quaternary ammonium compound efflux SMR transporter [Virgibacillus dakarensis]GGB36245.1 QacE family quaternary ammonium compound efflux SMR transporter [Lentibacillus populi]